MSATNAKRPNPTAPERRTWEGNTPAAAAGGTIWVSARGAPPHPKHGPFGPIAPPSIPSVCAFQEEAVDSERSGAVGAGGSNAGGSEEDEEGTEGTSGEAAAVRGEDSGPARWTPGRDGGCGVVL